MRTSMLVAVLLGTALSIPSTMAVAKKADPAAAAQRDTSRLVHDASDPYCTTGGKGCHGRHHHWAWGWHEEHHHHMHHHHHRHHKKAM